MQTIPAPRLPRPPRPSCGVVRRTPKKATAVDPLRQTLCAAPHPLFSSCFCRMSGKLCLIFGLLLSHRTL